VVRKIGAIARPDAIFFTGDLPKTRSGKIMRRLREPAAGPGDCTTLADADVVDSLCASGEGRSLRLPRRPTETAKPRR
jgi:acetyl-CoA synthetase